MYLSHKFLESPYFVPEFNNWHLKPGAPKEIRDEFNAMLKNDFENLSSLANLQGFFLCHKGTTIHRTLIFLVCWYTMLDTVYTVIHRCRTSYIHHSTPYNRC